MPVQQYNSEMVGLLATDFLRRIEYFGGGGAIFAPTVRGSMIVADAGVAWSEFFLAGAAGSFITRNANDPIWSTLTLPNAATQGDLLAATGANAIGRIADVAVGQPLLSGGVGVIPAYAGWYLVGTAGETYTFPATGGTIPTGTGVANQVTYWSGVSTLTGNAGLTFAPATGLNLTLGIATQATVGFDAGNYATLSVNATGDLSIALNDANGGIGIVGNATSPNIKSGYSGNTIVATATGSVIAGGGYLANINSIATANADIAVVSGGAKNTSSGWANVIGGGYENATDGDGAVVGGGSGNAALRYCTVPGGNNNKITGTSSASVILGGDSSTVANSNYAGVVGNACEVSGGDYSFGFGYRSHITHDGSFLWGDSTGADINSLADNEFALRARGGFRHAYDDANYWTAQVSAAGAVTLNAVGASAGFTISDTVNISVDATQLTLTNPTGPASMTCSVAATTGIVTLNAAGTTPAFIISDNVGVRTSAAPLAKLHIGFGTETTTGPIVLVSDIIDDTTGAGNVHSFVDKSELDRSGSMAIASFDAGAIFIGANDYDHYAAHKSRMYWQCSGTLSKYYGFYSDLDTTGSAGDITDCYRYYAQDDIGAGTIVNNYGLYIDSITKGTALNYSIYTVGPGQERFGDSLTVERAQNTATTIRLFNSTSDTAAREYIMIGRTSAGGQYVILQHFNTGYTALGLLQAELSALISTGSAGLLIGTTSGPVIFSTSGTAVTDEKARILSTGEFGIGTATPSVRFHDLLTNATTNAVDVAAIIGHDTSGMAANGFGTALKFQLESSATPSQDASQTSVLWTEATDANRTALERRNTVGNASFATGYDGIWCFDGLNDTARTVILNGTGDAIRGLIADVVCWAITGADTTSGAYSLTAGANVEIYNDGTDIVQLQMAADGSVTVQRTAGADTFKVQISGNWVYGT